MPHVTTIMWETDWTSAFSTFVFGVFIFETIQSNQPIKLFNFIYFWSYFSVSNKSQSKAWTFLIRQWWRRLKIRSIHLKIFFQIEGSAILLNCKWFQALYHEKGWSESVFQFHFVCHWIRSLMPILLGYPDTC